MKNLANEIVNWLGEYASKNNRKSFVIGVSGGIDSALVSTLCARTYFPTYCVVLPCKSKDDELSRADRHIGWLQKSWGNVHGLNINLTHTFEIFKDCLPNYLYNNLAFANTKSRLRMIALYQIATCYSGLVVGTGNKVEDYGVGFFTKHGDGGVDISPIGDLTKTEVRLMSKELGINEEILTVAPTDGLWDDARTDESQLGATYEELEWAMDFLDKKPSFYIQGSLTNRQQEVLDIYNRWHNAGAHKLAPIPMFKRKE